MQHVFDWISSFLGRGADLSGAVTGVVKLLPELFILK